MLADFVFILNKCKNERERYTIKLVGDEGVTSILKFHSWTCHILKENESPTSDINTSLKKKNFYEFAEVVHKN